MKTSIAISVLAAILSLASLWYSFQILHLANAMYERVNAFEEEQVGLWEDHDIAHNLAEALLGSSVSTTASSDTLETFRTNVNSSLSSLQNDKVSTTTAFSWTALQTFLANATTSQLTATSSVYLATSAGKVGIASSSPLGVLGIGNTGTSTISGNFFCAYFKDEASRGMWVKLSLSGNTVFSTSTSPCN